MFNELGDPTVAETWIRALESIFDFLHCTDRERLSCVTFQLTGPTDFWWEARKKTMTPAQLREMTWEEFKAEIYEKFIPKSYRKRNEVEFYHLEQGRISVTDYDRMFCEMARYQVDTDEKMAVKFCTGLRYEIRMTLASHRGLSYTEARGRALDIEAAMQGEKTAPAVNPTPPQLSLKHPGTRGSGKNHKPNLSLRREGMTKQSTEWRISSYPWIIRRKHTEARSMSQLQQTASQNLQVRDGCLFQLRHGWALC